jgi:hypothetical protein
MRRGLTDPVMAGLVSRVDEMNRLAEASEGFVWRLPGADVTLDALRVFEGHFSPLEPERLFYNLSVWQSVEDLRHFVFATAHAHMLRDKRRWMASFEGASLALWWVPAGGRPTVAESAERLRAVRERGPTPFAFTFRECFPRPAA